MKPLRIFLLAALVLVVFGVGNVEAEYNITLYFEDETSGQTISSLSTNGVAGEWNQYTLSVANQGQATDSVQLIAQEVPVDWDIKFEFGDLNEDSIIVEDIPHLEDGYNIANVTVWAKPAQGGDIETANIQLIGISQGNTTKSDTATLSITRTFGLVLSVTPQGTSGIFLNKQAGEQFEIDLLLESAIEGERIIRLDIDDELPGGWSYSFKEDGATVTETSLDGGESKSLDLFITVGSQAVYKEEGYSFNAIALDLSDSSVNARQEITVFLRSTANFSVNFSVNFVDDVVNLDVSPGASGIGCTEMVISNLGTITIDVDVELSGDNITISPGAVSVTLAPEGNITTPICALALTRSEARAHPVSVLASGRETNTHLNPVQVTSNFTAIVDPYARLSIQAPLPAKHCIGSTFWTNFTGVNNGNANDSVVFEVSNIQELEDAGFTFTLPILQYQLEPASFQNLVIKVDGENVAEGYYNMIVTISTTMDGESFSAAATYQIWMANCQEQDANIEDDSLPSISLIPALIAIGIIALRRRY